MADLTQPYDELAAHYDQIFEDWEASIARQATILSGILDRECGDKRPVRVLDCACGIGTQSLGLAMKGFDITGGWPTFTFFVKLGTHAADAGVSF